MHEQQRLSYQRAHNIQQCNKRILQPWYVASLVSFSRGYSHIGCRFSASGREFPYYFCCLPGIDCHSPYSNLHFRDEDFDHCGNPDWFDIGFIYRDLKECCEYPFAEINDRGHAYTWLRRFYVILRSIWKIWPKRLLFAALLKIMRSDLPLDRHF